MKKMQIRERKANIKSYSGQEEEEMLMAKELEMTKLRKIMNQGTPRDRGGGEGATGRPGESCDGLVMASLRDTC